MTLNPLNTYFYNKMRMDMKHREVDRLKKQLEKAITAEEKYKQRLLANVHWAEKLEKDAANAKSKMLRKEAAQTDRGRDNKGRFKTGAKVTA